MTERKRIKNKINYNAEHKYLYEHKLIMVSERDWESKKIGAGAPPIRTEVGWLLLYHGVDEDSVYRAGAVLLDLFFISLVSTLLKCKSSRK